MIRKVKVGIITVMVAALFAACTQEEVSITPQAVGKDSILLLKVGYTSNCFEGGYELNFSQKTTADSIPANAIYEHPCDFGGLTLLYAPTKDTIFHGTIVWSGCGKQCLPTQLKSAEQFGSSNTAISTPANTRFQTLYIDSHYQPKYDAIWSAVSKLNIVASYSTAGNKIGIFLYTPSIGAGSPNDWSWYIVMKR